MSVHVKNNKRYKPDNVRNLNNTKIVNQLLQIEKLHIDLLVLYTIRQHGYTIRTLDNMITL